MRDLFKAALLGAIISFLMVPSILVAAVRLLRLAQNNPLGSNLFSIYALYGSVAVVIFGVIGLPMLAFYRRRGWDSWLAFSLGGIVVAIIGEGLILSGVGYWDWSNLALCVTYTLMLAACGFFAGTVFWAVAKGSSLLARR